MFREDSGNGIFERSEFEVKQEFRELFIRKQLKHPPNPQPEHRLGQQIEIQEEEKLLLNNKQHSMNLNIND